MDRSRIAIDVMGGDNAPDAHIQGALQACDPARADAVPPERVLLVGDESTIREQLDTHGGDPGFAIVHASQVVGMDEKPGQALRAKPDSSIAKCIGAVKTGKAGGVVSMGNTGAVVGAATLSLGTLPGVRRPGIAVTLDLTGTPVTLLDMGANVVPKPQHLAQYGVMGSVYLRDCLGVETPSVGLLNVGEEANKGTELLRSAHQLLAASELNFIGNIEGDDIFRHKADVVVTDGFTGNVVLKLIEDYSAFMLELVMRELDGHGAPWSQDALERVRTSIDYSEYGGALLLGVAGIVLIGHGRSDATAMANAIRRGTWAIDADVNADIVKGLESESGQGVGT
jgi:glycerol-3-phosphate acyltransferase PlsX